MESEWKREFLALVQPLEPQLEIMYGLAPYFPPPSPKGFFKDNAGLLG